MTITDCKICALLKHMRSLTGSCVRNAFTQGDLNQHIIWYIINPVERTSGNFESQRKCFQGCECWCPVQPVQVVGQCMHRSSGGPGSIESQCCSRGPCNSPGKGQKKSEGRDLVRTEWAISGLQRYNGGRNWAHCLCIISPAHNFGENISFELIIDL